MTTIRFFNTLSGQAENFSPLQASEVRMYTCGPTVYDFAHIGNFRAFVFEDLLRRFLEFKGYRVKHVMNLTDVDDKTIAGAKKEGKALDVFTKQYIDAFREDLKTLNILPPNYPAEQPRATCEIPAMIELIEKLVKKGAAYTSEGSVYYRVSAFPGYGKLSKKKLEGNIRGARVDVDEYDKEEGADFALWKKAKEGEPAWDSPWGKGRPGWHIECSAMSMKHLGETFDIHAGGEDLIFPHHENEIAQSEAATGKPFVKYWLHCKHLLVNGEKMSKSKGNFYTLRDLLAKGYDPMAIRYVLLATHYRQRLNFTEESLKAAKESLKRIRDCWLTLTVPYSEAQKSVAGEMSFLIKKTRTSVMQALQNDLNVSEALGEVFSFIKSANALPRLEISINESKEVDAFFNELDTIFGFSRLFLMKEIPHEIKQTVETRNQARQTKNYGLADLLRLEVHRQGYILEDTKEGTRIKKLL